MQNLNGSVESLIAPRSQYRCPYSLAFFGSQKYAKSVPFSSLNLASYGFSLPLVTYLLVSTSPWSQMQHYSKLWSRLFKPFPQVPLLSLQITSVYIDIQLVGRTSDSCYMGSVVGNRNLVPHLCKTDSSG
jgi:hypothetical protein